MNCFETIKKGILLLMVAIVISFFGCGEDEDEMPMEPTSSNSGGVIVDPVESGTETSAEVIVWVEIDDNGEHIEKPYSDEDMKRIDFFDQVQDQDVIIAKVKDKPGPDGVGLSGKRVEWILNTRPGAVGDIVETDDPGHQVNAAPQIKVDNKFAFTFTSEGEEKPKQLEGMGPDGMDITLEEGETWIIITSIAKGDTDITAFAPEIPRKKTHKIFAVKHWTDIKLEPPDTELTCINYCDPTPVGANEEIWVSTITSVLNGMALKDKRVEYTIEDNELDAIWVESGTTTFEDVSDNEGKVSATIKATPPLNPFQEIRQNTITIKVIDGADVLAAKKTIEKEWASEFLTIDMICPEGTGSGGVFGACDEVPLDITVVNEGKCDATVNVDLEYPSDVFDVLNLPNPVYIPSGQSITVSVNLKAKGVLGTWPVKAKAKSERCVEVETDECEIRLVPDLYLNCVETKVIAGDLDPPYVYDEAIKLTINQKEPKKKEATITLVVENKCPYNVDGGSYELRVTLPSSIVSYIKADPDPDVANGEIIWSSKPTIIAGEKKEFTFTVEGISAGAGIIEAELSKVKVVPQICRIPIEVEYSCPLKTIVGVPIPIEEGISKNRIVAFEHIGEPGEIISINVTITSFLPYKPGNKPGGDLATSDEVVITDIHHVEESKQLDPERDFPYEIVLQNPGDRATFEITLLAKIKSEYGVKPSMIPSCGDGR